MFGDMYAQMMRARLGVGKPMEGYGMTPMQTLPQQPQPMNGGVVPPWMQGGMWGQGRAHGPIPFEPRPRGGTIPMESPWNPRQTDFEPRPQGGESPWNPRQTPYEPKPQGTEQPSGKGYMGGMKNPWQRY